MRFPLLLCTATFGLMAALGSPARAAEVTQVRLVWSATSAGGTPGGSLIDPGGPAVVTLDVLLDVDNLGLGSIELSIAHTTPGLSAIAPLVGGTECPAPPNAIAGRCEASEFGGAGKPLSPITPGALFESGLVSRLELVSVDGAQFDSTGVVMARIEFLYTDGVHKLTPIVSGSTSFAFDGAVPNRDISAQVASAAAYVPEPGLLGQLMLGISVLSWISRRRKTGHMQDQTLPGPRRSRRS